MGDTNNPTKTRRVRRLLLILLLLSLPALPVVVLIAASSPQPLVQSGATLSPQDAQRLKRIFRQMELAGFFNRPQRLVISADDLNSLFTLGTRGIKRLNGNATISPQHGTELSLSIHVPENPFGAYINLTVGFPLSSQGVELSFLRIGTIEVDGDHALWGFKQLAALLVGRHHSEMLLNSVQRYRTHGHRLIVHYRPIPNLKQQLTKLLKYAPLLNEAPQRPEDLAAIRFYYEQLCSIARQHGHHSLAPYLSRAFSLARQRSHDADQAVAQNRAALLAIAILFGHHHFNEAIKAIPTSEIQRCQRPAGGTTLQGRVDFREHFVYSIFLKLMSDRDISLAIAEFKELSDTLRGGSGFNFADLAAGQAGIQFAEYATSNAGARRLQQQAALLRDEATFFPVTSQLAQGMSQQRFKQEFGEVDSERYRQLQQEIQTRIANLALYRGLSQ